MVSVDDEESFERLCRLCDVDPAGASRGATEKRLANRLAERRAAEWEEVLGGAGVAAAAVYDDLATIPADPRLSHLFEPVGIGGVDLSGPPNGGFAPRSPWMFT